MYDLEERTIKFSNKVISLCKEIYKDTLFRPLSNQLIRSGTSIGANYCEANGSVSKKDFRNKVHICKKEAQETRYWLRLIETEKPELDDLIATLLGEVNQLIKIFAKIAENSK